MFNLLIGVQMASWAIVVKRKIQSTCKRVRTSKKSNNNVGIINFTEVTIAKNGSYSINCWSIYFFSLRDTHFFFSNIGHTSNESDRKIKIINRDVNQNIY